MTVHDAKTYGKGERHFLLSQQIHRGGVHTCAMELPQQCKTKQI